MEHIRQKYLERSLLFKKKAAEKKQTYDRWSLYRLLIFVAAIGFDIFLWSFHFSIGLGFIFVFIPVFYRLVMWHQALLDEHQHLTTLSDINQKELGALGHDFQFFQSGKQFIDDQHPYSTDLDIFGQNSFFQYTNRCASEMGEMKLAEYLDHPASFETISARQQAIKELKDKLDWRQHFQAFGQNTQNERYHIQLLTAWLEKENFIFPKKWVMPIAYLMPIWTITGLVLYFYGLDWQYALLFLVPPGLILQRNIKKVNDIHQQTSKVEEYLIIYARILAHIEKEKYDAPFLKDLHQNFLQESRAASEEIKRLSYLISQLNVRYNAFAILLNLSMLWDLRWTFRLERWKEQQKERLPQWFASLQEFEALQSFATLFYNNPSWTFPTFHNKHEFTAKAMAHPLIHESTRISNNFSMPTEGHMKLITGSNMAGKSTFLRAIGINIVLAMAGAPVCAEALSLPRLQVYTSMRTKDALSENTSSFYAELKRLKVIIEAIEERSKRKNPPIQVFFLLDEILKGTNSNDRHTGSKALIKQLIQNKGAGLIATHDLELGLLEETAGGAIENWCMEVEIKNGELFFDYTLKRGVSKSFNATILMQNMGILIEE